MVDMSAVCRVRDSSLRPAPHPRAYVYVYCTYCTVGGLYKDSVVDYCLLSCLPEGLLIMCRLGIIVCMHIYSY